MINNSDIQQVFSTHETKYIKRAVEQDWRWTCTCGQEKFLVSREACAAETQNHWAGKISDLLPEEMPAAELQIGEQEVLQIPRTLAILSFLVKEVDCERMTMPQARAEIGKWFHVQDRQKITEPGRVRMRRLKQIADAMAEEFLTLLGSQP